MEYGWTYGQYMAQPEWFISEILAINKEDDLARRRAQAGKKGKPGR